MTLHFFPGPEAMLAAADTVCVPVSRGGLKDLRDSLLARYIPADLLPPAEELSGGKNGGYVFYGAADGRRIKFHIQAEGDHLTESSAYALSKKLGMRSRQDGQGKSALYLAHVTDAAVVTAAVAGYTAGQYDLGLFKKPDPAKSSTPDALHVLLAEGAGTGEAWNGFHLGAVQQEIMTLVNLPASHKSPEYLGHWAERSAKAHGYACEVLKKEKLEELGMYAFLAVNRGSELPARLVITHYRHPEATKKVALIGKGVVFDTGGLSIKDSKNMHYMKSDMAGAAAALGTVEACARLGLRVDVMAVVPATDNSVDALSTKPGDVVTSYSGKTIEIIDTDAEGRLVLADALAYAAQQYKPDVMIDLATLTGSIVAAIGPQAAGLFTKNDDLAAALLTAGFASGERVWRMPMFDEYADDMQSDIADIKNLSDKPYAGSITAAKFLEAFTAEHPAWAHLDIAGMGFQPNGFGKGYCATGYGVRLLVKWLAQAGMGN
jgi:leucyl aminopeptidase